jgi:thiosulfate reductase cytochrome b subunit
MGRNRYAPRLTQEMPMPSLVTPRDAAKAATAPPVRQRIYRHTLVVRICHWVNVVCLTALLMSGLQIFNAHPALYWGDRSTFDHPWLSMSAGQDDNGDLMGITNIAGHWFNTTGVLGLSKDSDGEPAERGFPSWATLPGPQWLSMGRRWHFFFAWLFVINAAVYVAYTLLGRHLRRDLLPTGRDLAHIGRSLWDHLRLRFPKGEAAKRYNVLQKLAYLAAVFVLGPLIVLAGLTLSPRMDASFPVLLDIFGGRQSARSIHFLCATALLAFVIIHLTMVLISGVWNNLRSMITGRYDIDESGGAHGR